ncbi:MAG TPA: cyclic nucleotide-binding domain-containing protein [Candidatus Limnocylindria bacterium]|nr:cyclic nucleotide-binding domain-containing protein [Candidatus Limnocylindria bacterium]
MPESLAFGPFFLLDQATRDRLRDRSTTLKLAQGDVLIEEKQVGDDAYLLTEGSLRVVGEERTLAMLAAPALVGEMAAVRHQDRSATVVADTPCTVLRIPGKDLRRLMDDQPLFATAMRERADLLLADAFLKRKSPLRDLPAEIVAALAGRLRPREFSPDQLIEGRDDDLYLIRRGAIERLGDGQRTSAGDFVQRQRDERYAAAGETWIYELRMSDVASEIIAHQEKVRGIAAQLGDRAKVRAAKGAVAVPDAGLGGALVREGTRRVVVSEAVGALVPLLDGKHEVAALVGSSKRTRGEVVEGLAMLVAAGLARVED